MPPKIYKMAIALSALTLAIGATPANADNIVVNEWYNAFFGNVAPSPVFGPANDGLMNGPLPGGGTTSAIPAPTGAAFSITLPTPGYVVFTDLGTPGEQFQVFVNGMAASPTTNNLNPSGQAGLAGGFTSNPGCIACTIVGLVDIGIALSDNRYSSGTFLLLAGLNIITANQISSSVTTTGAGDVAFFVSSVPLPGAFSLFVAGLAMLGVIGRRRKRKAA